MELWLGRQRKASVRSEGRQAPLEAGEGEAGLPRGLRKEGGPASTLISSQRTASGSGLLSCEVVDLCCLISH